MLIRPALTLSMFALLIAGCNNSQSPGDANASALRQKLSLASAPAGAMTIAETRAKVSGATPGSNADIEEKAGLVQAPDAKQPADPVTTDSAPSADAVPSEVAPSDLAGDKKEVEASPEAHVANKPTGDEATKPAESKPAAKDDHGHDHDHADHDHADHKHDDKGHAHADHDHAHEGAAAAKPVDVVVMGVVGGVDDPWDDGHAAFMITDPTSEPAAKKDDAHDHDHAGDEHADHDHADHDHADHDHADHDHADHKHADKDEAHADHDHAGHSHAPGEEHDCPFCKNAKKQDVSRMAIVRFYDDQGEVIAIDSRKLFDLKPGSPIMVKGTATIDDLGNLIIAADGISIGK